MDEPVLVVRADQVSIGPQRHDLLQTYHRWLNDLQVRAALGESLRPVTLENGKSIFDETSAAVDQVWFTLYETASLRPIGITGLRDIDDRNRTAEYVVFIGEKDLWGRGLALLRRD